MELKEFFGSKKFKIIIVVFLELIVMLLIFQVGVFVGYKKASFSYQWGENYYKNFAGPHNSFMDNFMGKQMMAPHDVFGTVIKNENSSLLVRGMDNVEKIVLIGADTVINRFRDNIGPADLKINDKITVIGSPDNSGRIEAKFIRVVPRDFPATNTPGYIPPVQ
ncbi:MAG: hypothetical protein M1155_00105 [Patescibacteria group bacterium]|nr:hypothetical protein [Patescibacteria group bacterium]